MSTGSGERAESLIDKYEKRPDPVQLTSNTDPSKDPSSGVNYEPYPESSIKLEPEQEKIVQSICNLYSGSASEEDMQVYAAESVYDTHGAFAIHVIRLRDSGVPKVMAKSRTIKTEVVSSKPAEIIFKLQQEYTPKPAPIPQKVNSLVTLTLDNDGKVRYHKDMWDEKDYSHEGLGKVLKTLNGDHLTKITRPPDSL